ncbi:YncE family protein [Flavobacterium branchiicola]|uniref:YncE family protein n=1 Tax=Flavobacterium branchiicola TaxID=1114875 RepID=A0ABV9P8U9_9FLAO|nr:hypothetical protein [Flavobacterium branchiicola]MBS7253497.1 hypothetical protein [Flavobacterium branchiicola]
MGALLQNTIFGRLKINTVFYRGKAKTNLLTQMYTSFSPDGTRLYATLHNGPDSIAQYSLSPPWDVTTATYLNKSMTMTQNGESQIRGHYFSPDGKKIFVSGTTSKCIYAYQLATAWDVSTISYIGFYPIGTTGYNFFSSDGTMFFNHTGSVLTKYLLSTPWDLNTLTPSQTLNFSTHGFYVTPDGKSILYTKLSGARSVIKISLLNPYDLNTAYTSESIDLSTIIPGGNFYAVNFSPDGLKMFWSSYFTSIWGFDLSKSFKINATLKTT